MSVVCEGEGVDDGVEPDDRDGEEYSPEEVDASEDFGPQWSVWFRGEI